MTTQYEVVSDWHGEYVATFSGIPDLKSAEEIYKERSANTFCKYVKMFEVDDNCHKVLLAYHSGGIDCNCNNIV